MAEEHTGGHGETAGEYIQHHLTNLQVCRVEGAWVWNSAVTCYAARTFHSTVTDFARFLG